MDNRDRRSMSGCPVCGYPAFDRYTDDDFRLTNFEICSCCGMQSGYDYDNDADGRRFAELRAAWISKGAPWFSRSRPAPADWDAQAQLTAAGFDRSPIDTDEATPDG